MNVVERGGAYGVASGAFAGAALGVLLRYISAKRKKQRMGFAKSLLYGAIGAVGGSALGWALGRSIGSEIWHRRALKAAKDKTKKAPAVPGRVAYVNFPDNRVEAPDALKGIFPKGMPAQHAGVLVLNKDGSSAKLYHIGEFEPHMERAEKKLRNKLEQDYERVGDVPWEADRIQQETKALDHMRDANDKRQGWAEFWVQDFGNAFQGKSEDEITQIIADNGFRHRDMGAKVIATFADVKNVNFLETYAKNLSTTARDYSVIPGALNCGTLSRSVFDAATSNKWSHFRDYFSGGFPSSNQPAGKKYEAIAIPRGMALGYDEPKPRASTISLGDIDSNDAPIIKYW